MKKYEGYSSRKQKMKYEKPDGWKRKKDNPLKKKCKNGKQKY